MSPSPPSPGDGAFEEGTPVSTEGEAVSAMDGFKDNDGDDDNSEGRKDGPTLTGVTGPIDGRIDGRTDLDMSTLNDGTTVGPTDMLGFRDTLGTNEGCLLADGISEGTSDDDGITDGVLVGT